MTELYDAIIVGSGAGGAAAAFRLAEAGRRILVLEKGPELPTDGSTQDIRIVVAGGRFHNHDPWLDRGGREFVPQEYYKDEVVWRRSAAVCAGGVRGRPGAAISGWPFGYDELEPYYDQAETLLRVRSFEVELDTGALSRRSNASRRPGAPRRCRSGCHPAFSTTRAKRPVSTASPRSIISNPTPRSVSSTASATSRT